MPIVGGHSQWYRTCCCLCVWLRRRRFENSLEPEVLALSHRWEEILPRLGSVFFLLPPRQFSEYVRLESEIGAGSYGTVYRASATGNGISAICLQANKSYAVKCTPFEQHGFTEEISRSFLTVSADRHLQFQEMLSRPECAEAHIIRTFGLFVEIPTTIYHVMELLEGPDLFNFLSAQKVMLPESEAAQLVSQIFQAIHHLHRKVGALHRDIKPENFGFAQAPSTSGPRVLPALRLFDLGMAWVLPEPVEEETAAALLPLPRCGTALYMAPETWEGLSGPPSDVWGAGVISYLLLTFDLPYGLMRCDTTLRAVRQNTLEFVVQNACIVSSAARSFVATLLEKNPAARSTTSAALAACWLRETGVARNSPMPLLPGSLRVARSMAGRGGGGGSGSGSVGGGEGSGSRSHLFRSVAASAAERLGASTAG
mmetsp:Transcript_19970/g.69313  ORF Transcript_19970/g.69313 Transcript_19970/m.69313 type:complete len:427 (-) Transcript_19970:255-1535(-)